MVEAEAEHAVAEEERDLRRRLLEAHQAQQDGLQVLVHKFRTPIASLEALTSALTSNTRMTEADRAESVQLTNRHAQHLRDMIDALSDVASSRHPRLRLVESGRSSSQTSSRLPRAQLDWLRRAYNYRCATRSGWSGWMPKACEGFSPICSRTRPVTVAMRPSA